MPYTESKGVKFKIDILQGGNVVKTLTVENTSAAKLTAYDYSADVNVSGDFQILITNLSPSAVADSNKDRFAIWALNWTKME